MLIEEAPWIILGEAAMTFPIMLHNRNFSWLSLLCSSNQKEKEKENTFPLVDWDSENVRFGLSCFPLDCPDGPFEMDVSNFRARKGKRKLKRLKQGDFSLHMLVC